MFLEKGYFWERTSTTEVAIHTNPFYMFPMKRQSFRFKVMKCSGLPFAISFSVLLHVSFITLELRGRAFPLFPVVYYLIQQNCMFPSGKDKPSFFFPSLVCCFGSLFPLYILSQEEWFFIPLFFILSIQLVNTVSLPFFLFFALMFSRLLKNISWKFTYNFQ